MTDIMTRLSHAPDGLIHSVKNINQICAYLLIISSLLYLYSIGVIIKSPWVSGYEFQLFENNPELRYTLVASLISAVLSLLLQIASPNENQFWKKGIVFALLAISTILLLPLLRGYFLLGYSTSDVLAHLGYVKDLENNNQISNENWYPVIHLLLYSVYEVTNINLNQLSQMYQPGLHVLSVLGTALFIRRACWEKGLGNDLLVIGACASLPLLYANYREILPSIQLFMMVPLLLFIFSLPDRRQLPLVLIISIFIVFSHPVTTLFVVIISAVYLFANKYRRVKRKAPFLATILVMGIAFSTWLLTFELRVSWLFRNIFQAIGLIDADTSSVGSSTADGALSVEWLVVMQRFLEIFGSFILYMSGGVLTLLLSLIIYNRASSLDSVLLENDLQFLTSIGVSFLFLFVLSGGGLIGSDFFRMTRYSILFSSVLVSVGMYILISDSYLTGVDIKFKRVMFLAFSAIIVFSLIISGLTVHDGGQDIHVTQQENDGTIWMSEYHNKEIPIYGHMLSHKIMMLDMGGDTYNHQYDGYGFQDYDEDQDHRRGLLNQTSSEDPAYVITNERDKYFHKQYHESQYDSRLVYTESDYESFSSSPSNNKIYSNPELSSWIG
jgi:hypothetical protein